MGQVGEVHEGAMVKKKCEDKDGRKGAWPQKIQLGHVGRICGQRVGSRGGVVYSVAESGASSFSEDLDLGRESPASPPPHPQPALCPGTSLFTTYVERPPQISRLLSLVCHPRPYSSSTPCTLPEHTRPAQGAWSSGGSVGQAAPARGWVSC